MTIGGIMAQNYRAFGWLIIAASAIGGGLTIAPLLFFIFRKHIARWLCRGLSDKNNELRRGRERDKATISELENENARLRSNWGQAVIKASQGVSTVLSAFGLDAHGGRDERD